VVRNLVWKQLVWIQKRLNGPGKKKITLVLLACTLYDSIGN